MERNGQSKAGINPAEEALSPITSCPASRVQGGVMWPPVALGSPAPMALPFEDYIALLLPG